MGGVLGQCDLGHSTLHREARQCASGKLFSVPVRRQYNAHVTGLLWEVGGDGERAPGSVSFPSQRPPLTGGWSQPQLCVASLKFPEPLVSVRQVSDERRLVYKYEVLL